MTTKNELIAALVKSQMEILPPKKDKVNPRFKSSYCSLDSIYDACRVPLAKNGLTLSHSVAIVDGKHMLYTTLYHTTGETLETTMPMFIDQPTSQGFGSACTYAKKVAVCSLLGLPTEEDDDGNAASTPPSTKTSAEPKYLSDQQCREIDSLIQGDMELLNRILSGYQVSKLKDIAAEHFFAITRTLKSRLAQ